MNHRFATLASPLALALGLALAPAAQAALPPGLSGAWYNPEQSGHGLSVKIIAPDRALVFWYLYDTEGRPFFLYMDGRVEGRRIEATALAPTGLRFGSFDRSDFAMPEWGTVVIEFDDCSRGQLHWDADSPEFGSGSTELRRLTGIHASECVLSAEPPALQGRMDVQFEPSSHIENGLGAIDPNGQIWAAYFEGVSREASPTNGSITDVSCIGHGSVLPGPDGQQRVRWRELPNHWTRSYIQGGGSVGCDAREWQGLVEQEPERLVVPSPRDPETSSWQLQASADVGIVAPLTLAAIARDYTFDVAWQFGAQHRLMTVQADGTVCLTKSDPFHLAPVPCGLRGRLWLSDPQAGFFDFELSDTTRPEAAPYLGRGWLEDRHGDGRRIVLIGHNHERGLGVVGR